MKSKAAWRNTVWRRVWALPLLLLTACEAPLESVARAVRTVFPQVTQHSVSWLVDQRQAHGDEILLLDVRTPEEFGISHIEGARRAATLEEARALLGGRPKDQLIVVYCSVGYRSSQLAALLLEGGYTQVVNLEGSIFAWANAGEPVVRDGREVRAVHPYGPIWERFLAPKYREYPADRLEKNR